MRAVRQGNDGSLPAFQRQAGVLQGLFPTAGQTEKQVLSSGQAVRLLASPSGFIRGFPTQRSACRHFFEFSGTARVFGAAGGS
jgi:hypothetical protein